MAHFGVPACAGKVGSAAREPGGSPRGPGRPRQALSNRRVNTNSR
jgi:hypothetical protein